MKLLPKIAYDFIEGGLEGEVGIARNYDVFSEYRLVPRYCVDVTARDQSTTLFGKTYSSPVGIAPTGLIGLFRRGGDMMLAEAAKDAGCWARVIERRIQASDHPVILTVPETLYLKCFILELRT